MMYGLLIGLIIAAVILWASNGSRQDHPVVVQRIQSLVRITACVIFMSSTGALIGLLIQGT